MVREPESFSVKLWVAVALVSTITLGNYYLFDLPGAIGIGPSDTWQAWFHANSKLYTEETNGLLYSIYSWPNVFLGLVGGVLVDQVLGLRQASLAFTMCVLFGSCITYFGVVGTSVSLLIVGRLVFGLGGETQIVAQYAFVSNWFVYRRGSSLAFGVVAAVQRLGAAVTFSISPWLAQSFGVLVATAAATVVSIASLASLAGVLALHGSLDERPAITSPDPTGTSRGTLAPRALWASIRSTATAPLIVIALGNALFSLALYGFCAVAVPYIMVRDGVDAAAAGGAVTAFFLVVVISAPIAGYLIDRTGHRLIWLTAACIMASGSSVAFAHNTIALSGLQYCLLLGVPQAIVLASVYPVAAHLVHLEHEGFAFGLLVGVQNAGMATAMWSSGFLLARANPGAAELLMYARLSDAEAVCYGAAAACFILVSYSAQMGRPKPGLAEATPLRTAPGETADDRTGR